MSNFIDWCLTTNYDKSTMDKFLTQWRVKKSWDTLIVYTEIYNFLINYFLFEWQIIISRNIGGGIWDSTDFYIILFLKFMESYVGPRVPINLPMGISEEAIIEKKKTLTPTSVENSKELISFLTDNHAQSSIADIELYLTNANLVHYIVFGQNYDITSSFTPFYISNAE